MAKQIGLIKLRGRLGDLSFYKSRDGDLVRFKGGPDKKRFFSDPAYKRARENSSEFTHASLMDSNFRTLLGPVIGKIKDGRVHTRLVSQILKAIKEDTRNVKGKRLLQNSNLNILEGFEFNKNMPLSGRWNGKHSTILDRNTGDVSIHIPAFDPSEFIVAPEGSSHFRFVLGVLAWDIAGKAGSLVAERSTYLPKNEVLTEGINLSGKIPANTGFPVIYVLGIEFSQEVNSKAYRLEGCGRVVEVCG